ncbi:glycosyltransferase [Jatrophihabitans telluris]|uniref:Glycosyltransferase n=1 Tax=Jatrophihabitans telluris TaxID=2038343 RepID=A0ABY4QY80_9ACTN|nr:glycosyltransferase [Jatrophihabitans telluris]UQX87870.1 glycosyltransferase [Jatrophihabitans telluris]
MAEPTIGVVVCVYTEQRWNDISAGINALDRQSLKADQILIVVDHNEALEQRCRSELTGFGTPVEVVPNKHAQGLSGARNTAVELLTTDLIAFLDDDACPDGSWLERLAAPFSDDDVWISGGHSSPGWPDQIRPRWFPAEFDWVVGSSYLGMPEQDADVRNVHGCSMLFRSSVFSLVGGFAEGVGRVGVLPMGCEETELCIRLQQERPGTKIRYVPSAEVLHRVSENRVRFGYFLKRCYAEGLSKAQIGKLVGASESTSDERRYASEVLPAGVRKGIRSALHGDVGGLGRAAAIIVGLLVTAGGYARGRVAG